MPTTMAESHAHFMMEDSGGSGTSPLNSHQKHTRKKSTDAGLPVKSANQSNYSTRNYSTRNYSTRNVFKAVD